MKAIDRYYNTGAVDLCMRLFSRHDVATASSVLLSLTVATALLTTAQNA